MTDTPRSDRIRTRYSTPEPELDDHRHQQASLPVVSHASPVRTRRGTLVSMHGQEQARPDLLQVDQALLQAGMITRDFEESAIVDDDRSVNEGMYARRGSAASPIAGRRNTFRRPRELIPERPNKSRDSSTSSRSISPPNSVDAFADPRRRERANTLNSKAPSDIISLHRTISGGTHRQRRPTFSGDNDTRIEVASSRNSAEEDICFPVPEEPGRTYQFDFEELQEFIAEEHGHTPVEHSLQHQNAKQTAKPRVFNDMRPNTASSVPKIITETLTPDHHGADSVLEKHDEELDEKLTSTAEPAAEPPINRWSFFSSEMDDTIHAAELGGLLMPGETFRDLFELHPDGGVWWLDMLNPTEEEIYAICKAFGIHPLSREDILTQEDREKVELFKSYYFVCFRSFYQMDKQSEDFMEPVNSYVAVFREGLITFTFCPNPHAANVRKRIGKLRDYLSLSADWICYAWIDDIVDMFGPVIRDIEIETDAIEDQVFTARLEDSRHILRAIGDCRKKVMSLLRLLGGKADVIKGFAKRCNEQYSVAPRGDVGLYLSDVQDHVVTMMSNLGHFEKMLSRSHSNYLAQLSVDGLAQGNATNETLGKVTLIATVLLPLNLITGLFGMNVPIPGMDSTGLGWFGGILGVILVFVSCSLLVAKRYRWI